MPTLRALECLVAVADTESITRAARLLHSSQPAVSHQLASLEREAETPLFTRGSRGMTLTPAGRAAVADARRAIEAAASAIRVARSVGQAAGGSLRLACAQSLTVPVLAPVLRLWHRRHPGVAVSLREAARIEEFLGYLEAGEVDMALVPLPAPDKYFISAVADEEIVLATATDHPLAAHATVRIEQLQDARIVHFAPENGLSGWLDASLADAGVRTTTAMRTAVSSAAPQLAAAGLGIAVCPVSAVTAGFRGAVRSFSPRWVRPLVAVTAGFPDPLAQQFISDLRRRGVHVPSDVQAQLQH